MKKSVKLILITIILVAIYIGLFYVTVKLSSPEDYSTSLWSFYSAVIFGIIAIPVGLALEWFLSKKKLDKKKKDLIILVIAVVYGFLFGWINILAIALGATIIEKDK